MSIYASLMIPALRTSDRRSSFGPGEMVRHYGESAVVVGFNRTRGVRLRSPAGGRSWYAEPEECEPVY